MIRNILALATASLTAAVTGIFAHAATGSLGEHVPLGRADVSHEIAERERALAMRPFDLVARNGRDNTARASTHAVRVAQEFRDARYDHDADE